MHKKISFAGPSITQKEIDSVMDGVKNGFYETFDQHVKKLEKAICDYLGRKYAIATHTGTLALHTANKSLGLKAGDEVICTDFSWVATAYSILYTGATPVFVDIDPDTWCIDPKKIREAINEKTKAIMLVHSFGVPAEMDEIMQIAKENNLMVVEDACPALGALYKGKKVGSFGDAGCFSFHGAKIAVSGEGGMFTTDREDVFEWAKLYSSMGRTDSGATFWSDYVGYQYTMANLTASLALAQVLRIEELVAIKRQIFSWYDERLSKIAGIKIVREKPDTRANYCYPSILLEDNISTERDFVLSTFKENNIHARPAFPRMSRFPTLEMRYDNPVATEVEKRGISLPSAANLNEEDIDYVCTTLKNVIKYK
ncbi:MAG: aminotransferase [Ignavibacteria bacterium]|nr:aminotransferase [Ignavibacteria bacterium]